MQRADILSEINAEREHAERVHNPAGDDKLTDGQWHNRIVTRVAEASDGKKPAEIRRRRLVQAAALIVARLESIDRKAEHAAHPPVGRSVVAGRPTGKQR